MDLPIPPAGRGPGGFGAGEAGEPLGAPAPVGDDHEGQQSEGQEGQGPPRESAVAEARGEAQRGHRATPAEARTAEADHLAGVLFAQGMVRPAVEGVGPRREAVEAPGQGRGEAGSHLSPYGPFGRSFTAVP